MQNDRELLYQLFERAVESANPGKALLKHLPASIRSQSATVVGAGKATYSMAKALNDNWLGSLHGAVVVPYSSNADAGQIQVLQASHPVPDDNGQIASNKMLSLVSNLGKDDLVIALVSGGGSALLACPPPGMTLQDEINLNEALLRSGAPISAMNAIRKQVSGIKGGRLSALAYPASVKTFIISDVPGDNPAQVASGPTVADEANCQDALNYIDRYGIKVSDKIYSYIQEMINPAPKPDSGIFTNCEVTIVASASMALEATAEFAQSQGLNPVILSDAIEGESKEVGKVMAAIAKDVSNFGRLVDKPAVILSGGETTVTLKGKGKGGRNTEFLLSLALEIEGWEGITALAADTDGIDGVGGHAGGFADGKTCAEIHLQGGNPAELLGSHNSYTAFEIVNSLIKTGFTRTNVNDFRAIIVR